MTPPRNPTTIVVCPGSTDKQTVSIWSVEGRLKDIPFTGRKEDLEQVREYRKGETDLVEHQGEFYLVATVDEPTPATFEPRGFLGVDLGVANIAATSDEVLYSGKRLNRKRLHYLNKRKELQKKGTKSARRRLRARSQKEARFARDTNHVISKKIVAVAERTGRGIGLEELTGIRERARSRKPQRARLHSWAFAQLGQYITYKAERAGVPVVFVDPAYTSRSVTCATTSTGKTGERRTCSLYQLWCDVARRHQRREEHLIPCGNTLGLNQWSLRVRCIATPDAGRSHSQ